MTALASRPRPIGHGGLPPARATAQLDSGGTMWRLRSLVAMGHDGTRIARALSVRPQIVREILRGDKHVVSVQLRDLTCQLWDAWWDKRPPERTPEERRAAAAARRRAERLGWCTPLGLDEDELDEPGYRPYSRYRPGTGTGIAGMSCAIATTTPTDSSRVGATRTISLIGNGQAEREPWSLAGTAAREAHLSRADPGSVLLTTPAVQPLRVPVHSGGSWSR
jgi:hypothetical protein